MRLMKLGGQEWQIFVNHYSPQPQLERTTFSGGRNLSAIARNAQQFEKCSRVHVLGAQTTWRMLVVPGWFYPQFIKKMRASGVLAPESGCAQPVVSRET